MVHLAAAQNGSNPLIPNVGEIIVGAIAFFIVFGILAKLSFPNIQRTFAERTERIEGGLKRAEEAQEEAQRTLADYRAQLADARQEANRIREQAYSDARAAREEIERDARTRADEMIARTEDSLQAMRQSVLLELRTEVGRLSVDLAERIVGSALESDERQNQIVDDFIAGLEGGAIAVSGSER